MNLWSQAAVAACVLISVGMGSYWLGKRGEVPERSAYESLLKRVQQANAERTSLDQAVANHVQTEAALSAAMNRWESDAAELRTSLQDLDRRSNELTTNVSERDTRIKDIARQRDALAARLQDVDRAYQESKAQLSQLKTAAQERDTLATRLRGVEDRYQIAQSELAKLADQLKRKDDLMLNARVRELSSHLDEQQQEIQRDNQYLAADRDIRELMGARQLYIADVFDVSGDGRTRKPFGRVFYTREKSLIFYAFDLDRQPGVRATSTFQVWGGREAVQGESARPVNLGVLYMDSESNRRWVLKSDDPRQLAEIDSVFVTVEPHGGSAKPTGKPFLYALLRKNANHP